MKRSKLKNKVWLCFAFFSVLILSFLWFFQVSFLNLFYQYQKKVELTHIASKIKKSYGSSNFDSLLDQLTYENNVCIEIVSENNLEYSSMNFTQGCLENNRNLTYKSDFLTSGLESKRYEIENAKFHNTTLVYALRLDADLYVFINVSLEPVGSTTKILANQLVYVTILVLLLGFVMAYFLSKRLSFPIVKLKDTASLMSKGEYDVTFDTDSKIEEIDELASTLNQACKELSLKDEVRREFLANVSHDLKTPLTMIKAYAEMVRDLTYKDDQKREDNLNTIIDETERLNLLVEDILNLSKIQSDVDTLMLEDFDLNKMILDILNKFRYLEEKQGYHFIYENKNKMMITADKRKLEQVIYNLIGNAVNYVGEDKQVIVEVKEDKNHYKVSVIDHGKGIDQEEIKFIWDKYYKVDKTHKRNIVGTGLGLSIVKNILLKHNFEYGVVSKKKQGSSFYFVVPKRTKK